MSQTEHPRHSLHGFQVEFWGKSRFAHDTPRTLKS